MPTYTPQDNHAKRARQEGYRARSVYKLEEIQQKFRILKPGDRVLDLGSAPGSFLQYIAQVIGEQGVAVGVDLQDIKPFSEKNIITVKADIIDANLNTKITQELNTKFDQKSGVEDSSEPPQFDVITSDLAPKTSGIKFMDGGASLQLSLIVLDIAEKFLKKGGNCIIKYLPGFNEGDLIGRTKKLFKNVKKYRPQAIRKSSGESYLVCLGKL